MPKFSYSVLLCFLASATSAAVLQPVQSLGNQDLLPVKGNLTEILLSNSSNPSLGFSGNVDCKADEFGADLRITSCREAFGLIAGGQIRQIFSDRNDQQYAEKDMALPMRWLSRESQYDTSFNATRTDVSKSIHKSSPNRVLFTDLYQW